MLYDENKSANFSPNPMGAPEAPANDTIPAAQSTGDAGANTPTGEHAPYQACKPAASPWTEPVYKTTAPVNGTVYSPTHHYANTYGAGNGQTPPPPKKQKSGGIGIVKMICLILVCTIVASAASAGAAYLVIDQRLAQIESAYAENSSSADSGSSNQVILGSGHSQGGTSGSVSDTKVTGDVLSGSEIYALGCEQVVGINSSVTKNVFGQTSTSAVSGSGFVISTDGYIMTNYHVIEYTVQYGYDLTVLFHDGTSYPAEVIGYEANNDVAVIKIDATGLNAVTFGDSGSISVGEAVYAIGNPLGELDYSMTSGIVSALDREISTDIYTTINMFQIDAAVNHGNSGGPVYNAKGEVIGIVTAKYSNTSTTDGVEGLGFAIPINDATYIAQELIENGYVSNKAYLGISAQDPSNSSAQYFEMPDGAYVYAVNPGSCAETAGLLAGDVITAVDDNAVTSVATLKTTLRLYAAGDSATLTIFRSGETLTLQVTFDEAPSPSIE